MKIFFTGLHQPADARYVSPACISVNRLLTRKKPIEAKKWLMDSGAFSALELHGRYIDSPEVYAEQIRCWAGPNLAAAVSQDYMCESFMLAKTGLSVAEHHRLTIERYDAIQEAGTAGIYVMPVLQGYEPKDYVNHLAQYEGRLDTGAWVGVGSVCKRNANPNEVLKVLRAIKEARPDLLLHGFGLKTTALWNLNVIRLLYSADSMAWSFAARFSNKNQNSWQEAKSFSDFVHSLME